VGLERRLRVGIRPQSAMCRVPWVICLLLVSSTTCFGRGLPWERGPGLVGRAVPLRVRGGVKNPGQAPKPSKPRTVSTEELSLPGAGVKDGVRETVDVLERDSRLGFVRKVYGLLSVQLFVTFGTVLYFSTHKSQVIPLVLGPAGRAAAGLAMVTAFSCPMLFQLRPSLQEERPANFFLLSAFTIAESYLVGMVSLMYTTSSVLLVLGQTALATLALSIYAFQPNPKFDMNQLGSMLYSALTCLMGLGLVSLFLNFDGLDMIYSALCAIMFSGFIVFDTKRLVSGEHPEFQLQRSQYIMGSMALYMDIVGLFLHLLRLFGEEDK